MILFLDTSALLKLYVQEENSEAVRDMSARARVVAASRLAYAEARAALARACRERRITDQELESVLLVLHQDWPRYFVIEVSADIVRYAGDLAQEHALRAYDALQLASALTLRNKVSTEVCFLCFDDVLNQAAQASGLSVDDSSAQADG
jgi:uncharacterized protein